MADRREALKIIGAISSTCAFPFVGDELFAQHVHPPAAKEAVAGPPQFFSDPQMALLSRLADLIIPPSDTPGAVQAGVPSYIDLVVSKNADLQKVFIAGLQWLESHTKERHDQSFMHLDQERQIAILQPLSDAVDGGASAGVGEQFFRSLKNLTADGYYTSRAGLMDELGYRGNTPMAEFPVCEVPEH